MNKNKNPQVDVSQNLKNLYATDEKDKQEVYAKMKNKQKKQYKKPAIAAACALLIATLPFTSFGGGIVNTVKQAVSPSGRIVVNEDEPAVAIPFPDELKGKVFDKEGNEITDLEVLKNAEHVYSKDGREIVGSNYDEATRTGEVTFEYADEVKKDTGDKAPVDVIAKKLNFNPLVFSEKYNYVESEIFADPGTLSDYVAFTYEKDGKTIYLNERISSPETAYETGGEGKIYEVNVDGVKVIIQGRDADFERDGLLVSISAEGADKDDLIAMVKDLHLLK
ncbi:MAG: hypothetical protein KH322_03600 [Peptoniphilaceae bacterium]|uniref:hypothetical protein n=1 Tax=Aedoeadaptatus acetigenes TaxID=2981723 RepID=UPI0011DD9693|nr:hypothetical protein [Aedoeadaptatus acetigenes]MBS6525086.1 hypothetical protein [Peptoniphilaceae bacterium]MCU6786742.1 hypothetical protein [Aedoeadaptatus acetigenes]